MLTYSELVELEHSLRESSVLSVYIDAAAADPAVRHARRRVLDDALRDLERTVQGAAHPERAAFERSLEHLTARLAPMGLALGAPGWAAFATPDGVRHAESLPIAPATAAYWGGGARVAPYVAVLTHCRPVVVAIVDAREAHIFRQIDGVIQHVDTLHAQVTLAPPYHMGDAPRDRFHPGTRGTTGTDAAERAHRHGTQRMLGVLGDRLAELAGQDAWIVIGGMPQTAHAALAALPPACAERTRISTALDLRASEADIRRQAEEAATSLRETRESAIVAEAIEQYGADALGVAGSQATWRALEGRSVRELLLTPRFVAEHGDEAEAAVRVAFDQRALVSEVSGAAAERLDREGGGLAARLRFPVPLHAAPRA